MKPKLIGLHAYEGSEVTVRNGRHSRRGVISHCDGEGMTLYCRLYRPGGYELNDAAVPVPYSRVIEIKHGLRSTAPKHIKDAYWRGVR